MNDEKAKRIHALLDNLEMLAPQLDEGVGSRATSAMPTSEPFRYYSNPPLQTKTATLVNAVLMELGATYQVEQINYGTGTKKLLTIDTRI